MAVNFGVQILIVRYFSKPEFGAYAYALSVVNVAYTFVTFGLDRAVTRFVPIYEEQGAYAKLFGTLALAFGAVLSLGTLALIAIYGLRGWIEDALIGDPLVLSVLVVLILMAPIRALGDVFLGLMAVFASPRAIFFRRHILPPLLRAVLVGVLIAGQFDVVFFAAGTVVTSIIGSLAYVVVLANVMRRRGLFGRFDRASLRIPFREVLGFTVPLLTSDLVFVVMHASDALLLGYFHNAQAVAEFRVVQPAADLNVLVMGSFTLLFTPMAARLFARHDHAGIHELYWRTAAWMAILSLPIFLLTFSLAGDVVVALYGDPYQASGVYLTLLALGYYFNAALGFNGLTLKVFGKVRYVVIINLAVAVLNVALNLLLIPSFGALGAAIGTLIAMVVHNFLKQAGLQLVAGLSIFDPEYARLYALIALSSVGLLAIQLLLHPPLYIGFVLAAGISLAVTVLNRKLLDVPRTFPELLRIPLVRRIFG